MGVVYLAYSLLQADGLVALKIIQPWEVAAGHGQVERFLREQRILQELDHPHIVPFHEMGEAEGLLFFRWSMYAVAMRGASGEQRRRRHSDRSAPPAGYASLLRVPSITPMRRGLSTVTSSRQICFWNRTATARPSSWPTPARRAYQTSTLSGVTMKGDVAGTIMFMAPEQVNHLRESQPPVDLLCRGCFALLASHRPSHLRPAPRALAADPHGLAGRACADPLTAPGLTGDPWLL